MKFIHLSDLHIGKRLNEYSMLEDQEYILDRIIEVIDAEMPCSVIIAGDVYDKAVPSAEAVGLFDDFLTRLSERDIHVFIISGNHDSPERIAFGSRLMEGSGIHLSRVYSGSVEPYTLTDEFGKINILCRCNFNIALPRINGIYGISKPFYHHIIIGDFLVEITF